MKKTWLEELQEFDTAQSIDAWDDANDIGDSELDSYLNMANNAKDDGVGVQLLWPPEKPSVVYSSILKKMIDVKTGLPVEE